MTEPRQKRGRSRQDVGTPWEFIHAVEARWGKLDVDLAARADNAKAPRFVTPEQNSLTVPWAIEFFGMQGWHNPPFARCDLWAAKCREEAGAATMRVIMLTPASVSTEWFVDHVHGHALVLAVRPRITFVGEPAPFPKDLMLTLWNFGETGFDTWRWK